MIMCVLEKLNIHFLTESNLLAVVEPRNFKGESGLFLTPVGCEPNLFLNISSAVTLKLLL